MDEQARVASGADLEDLVRLAELAASAIESERGGWMHLQEAKRQPPLAASFLADLDADGTTIVVGTIDGVIVGYGCARLIELRDGDLIARVDDLFVEPPARGVAIGELVMDRLMEWATERGCRGIDAIALPGDRETKNFFERFGLTARAIVVHRRLT
jgi:GNAT superfamily N-acetyltransferase